MRNSESARNRQKPPRELPHPAETAHYRVCDVIKTYPSSVDAAIVLPEEDDRLRTVLRNCERAKSVSNKEVSSKESEGDPQKLMPAATKRARPDVYLQAPPPFWNLHRDYLLSEANKEVQLVKYFVP